MFIRRFLPKDRVTELLQEWRQKQKGLGLKVTEESLVTFLCHRFFLVDKRINSNSYLIGGAALTYSEDSISHIVANNGELGTYCGDFNEYVEDNFVEKLENSASEEDDLYDAVVDAYEANIEQHGN